MPEKIAMTAIAAALAVIITAFTFVLWGLVSVTGEPGRVHQRLDENQTGPIKLGELRTLSDFTPRQAASTPARAAPLEDSESAV